MSRSTATRMVLLAVANVLVAGTHLPALSAAPGTYVAVGDSFTAGPGVLNQQLHQIGCFRSDHNYPNLVACQLPGVRWVEPLVPLSPAAPVHPNALGMQGMATVLAGAMGG